MQQLQRNAQLKIISCFPLTRTWHTAVNPSVAECRNSKHSKCKISITKRFLWSVTTCICKNKTAVWFYTAKIFCSCLGCMIKPTFSPFTISKESLSETQKSTIIGQFCHQFHWTPSQIPDVFIFENT